MGILIIACPDVTIVSQETVEQMLIDHLPTEKAHLIDSNRLAMLALWQRHGKYSASGSLPYVGSPPFCP